MPFFPVPFFLVPFFPVPFFPYPVASATKRSHIFNFISKEKLDIIRLQETHLTDNDNTSDIF